MNRVARLQDQSLRRQERELGFPVIIYRGKTIPCVPGPITRTDALGEPGPPVEDTLRKFTIRKSAVKVFTADTVVLWTADQDQPEPLADSDVPTPFPGKIIKFTQEQYVFKEIVEDPSGAAWVVTGVSPN